MVTNSDHGLLIDLSVTIINLSVDLSVDISVIRIYNGLIKLVTG
jgi:hypothetical protein